ncbi:hypothetical protein G7Z17_g13235 [Cylindrodendrum hubeiense]|uniref:Uncharacterized protein n=1 Tax=Cylindrodendrum hubeiense TaxID=595255 RepID=A0A9P5L9I1_9HYPO|nr:hypothetical protein G7Z17_g13235 [Cylindrodendrum hubeiense]
MNAEHEDEDDDEDEDDGLCGFKAARYSKNVAWLTAQQMVTADGKPEDGTEVERGGRGEMHGHASHRTELAVELNCSSGLGNDGAGWPPAGN